MKTSELISALQRAYETYGDQEVCAWNTETSEYEPVQIWHRHALDNATSFLIVE